MAKSLSKKPQPLTLGDIMRDNLKGKGWFVNEYNIIYVQGSINKKFKRKSTRLQATAKNIAYVKKNNRELLIELLNEDQAIISKDFERFGREIIADGIAKVGKRGGRGELDQKDAISKFERLILPHFKSYAIDEIKVAHIEKWQNRLLLTYSSSSVNKCRILLNQIMHKACANDLIIKNPCQYAEKIYVQHQKQSHYTIEETIKMMTQSKGFIHTYLNLAFTTGMRTGELLALKYEDINIEHSCINLKRSVTKGRLTIGNNGHKNHDRLIPLLPQVLEILLKAKETSTSDWIFPSRNGTYYKESKSIVNKYFKPLLSELNIKYITLYATRHTFATIVENLRINSQTITDMIGNSEEVRLKHYSTIKMTKERTKEAQENLAPAINLFFPNNAK